MSKFIQVTKQNTEREPSDGQPVWLNVDHIVNFQASGNETYIGMVGETFFYVKETVTEIFSAIATTLTHGEMKNG